MRSEQARNVVVTPEAVAITLDFAGFGSRTIAFVIDYAVIVGGTLALALVFGVVLASFGAGVAGMEVVTIVLYFVALWGYFFVSEALWNGQTIGKRAQRLRVIRTDGRPVGWASVLVRNLLRPIDLYLAGLVLMLLTRRSQRIGDLAAGTLVVRERSAPAPAPLFFRPHPSAAGARGFDTAALRQHDYSLIRSFLVRRDALVNPARGALAAQVATAVRERVPEPGTWSGDDESFLEAVVLAYRSRFVSDALPPRPDGSPGP